MSNFKRELLSALNEKKLDDKTLNKLSKYQSNLMKNNSNPVFNKEDKNKLLNLYNVLQEIGKSIYRYNMLKSNNINVQEEQTTLENIVLKGSISNVKYVWHSEHDEHTCNECLELDGKEFDMFDEVPERPHPNCKCYIEIVEYSDNTSSEDEPCDILNEINELISNMESTKSKVDMQIENLRLDIQDYENDVERIGNLIQDNSTTLEILREEYGKHLPNCENNLDAEYEQANYKKITLQELLDDIKKLLKMGKEGVGTFLIFLSNYVVLLGRAYLLKQYEMDKYYHSKANCEAVQIFGDLGEEAAILLSDTKEKFDQWEDVYAKSHKVTIEEAIADSERDQVANRLGRERGRKYPNCRCYELMTDLKPKSKK